MADKPQYRRGKNPNSLKNLKQGFKDKETQLEVSRKGNEVQKLNKSLRESIKEQLNMTNEFIIKGADGKKEVVLRTKLEQLAKNFIADCVSNPTPQKMEELRKILGEDETTINVRDTTTERFADVDIPKEEKVRLAMMIMEKSVTR